MRRFRLKNPSNPATMSSSIVLEEATRAVFDSSPPPHSSALSKPITACLSSTPSSISVTPMDINNTGGARPSAVWSCAAAATTTPVAIVRPFSTASQRVETSFGYIIALNELTSPAQGIEEPVFALPVPTATQQAPFTPIDAAPLGPSTPSPLGTRFITAAIIIPHPLAYDGIRWAKAVRPTRGIIKAVTCFTPAFTSANCGTTCTQPAKPAANT